MNILLCILLLIGASVSKGSDRLQCGHCMLLAEQSQNNIVIIDTDSGITVWKWDPSRSGILPDHIRWFNAPSDAKWIRDGKYILMTASGGGVAMIRISDAKTVFYAYAGGNTHSAELLPDGNIVAASSTGNYLTLFRTDTVNYPSGIVSKRIPNRFGHNVVWDKKRNVLMSTSWDHIVFYKYNGKTTDPLLTRMDSVRIPGNESHDLFPVFGEDALWLTTIDHVFRFDPSTKEFRRTDLISDRNIKSVSSGPDSYPVIIVRPKVSWWTDEILDMNEKSVFLHEGFKVYKARWFVKNTFSY